MKLQIGSQIEIAVPGTHLYIGLERCSRGHYLSVYHVEGKWMFPAYDRLEGTARDFYRLRREILRITKSLHKNSVLKFSIWSRDDEEEMRIRAADLIFGIGTVEWEEDPRTLEVNGKVCVRDITTK